MAELAINGGKKLKTKDFPKWHIYTENDRKNLLHIYENGKWGYGGEQTEKLKKNMAAFSGVKYCIPVANGTVSIELIMRGLGIGRGDEVIVPPYTFIASISALVYAGVTPVFADIDPDTGNLSPESAEKCITERTKVHRPQRSERKRLQRNKTSSGTRAPDEQAPVRRENPDICKY